MTRSVCVSRLQGVGLLRAPSKRQTVLYIRVNVRCLICVLSKLSIFHFIILVSSGFTTLPSDQTVMEGEEVTFYCAATGNPAPSITWTKDGNTLASGNTLKFTALKNDSGEYLCSAENGVELAINASAHLDVQCKFCPVAFSYDPLHR